MASPTESAGPPREAVTLHVADEVELWALAGRLAGALPIPAFVALRGDLGAGKTTFVKGVAAACGLDPAEVTSPTFGLIHRYHPPLTEAGNRRPELIVHADMYRLTGIDELAETGWDDAVAGRTWVFVEWPERIAAALPAERIDLLLTITAPTARSLALEGRGPAHAAAVAAVRPA
jgi:tRNA threonylcarbamoyl adenosine modification protein YjeE